MTLEYEEFEYEIDFKDFELSISGIIRNEMRIKKDTNEKFEKLLYALVEEWDSYDFLYSLFEEEIKKCYYDVAYQKYLDDLAERKEMDHYLWK